MVVADETVDGANGQPSVVLSVHNVKKKIKDRWIIKGVTFDVRAGEIFGFLGPNGSGKTTTIRMLVNLIRPTEGTITLCGHDVQSEHNEALRYVGCIVENPELYSYLSGWENLEHFARMIPGVTKRRIHEVVAIVGLDGRIHDKVKTYSLGMRQRLGIAQALLGNPRLLILDEPTNGLDPQGIKEMREFIRRLADGGLSLFVSSHLLSEIQQLCDRVAIISHGEVIYTGEVDRLISEAERTVVWRLEPAERGEAILRETDGVDVLPRSPETLAEDPQAIWTRMDEKGIPDLNRKLVEAGVRLYAVEQKSPTLEDLFLRMTEGETIG